MTNLRVYSDQIGLSKKDLFELENCDLKIKLIEDFLFTDINHFKRCNINISVSLFFSYLFFLGFCFRTN